jgi:hypothetical protein
VKLSQANGERRREWIAYVDRRWQQLSDLELEFGTEAVKYLFATNAGAAVGVLAYLGAAKPSPLPKPLLWMLTLFALGVVLVGLVHAARFHGVQRLYRDWRGDVREFYGDRIEWPVLLDRDTQRSAVFQWDVLLGWCSLGCFIAGAVIGFVALVMI